jgi:hypothetical protein
MWLLEFSRFCDVGEAEPNRRERVSSIRYMILAADDVWTRAYRSEPDLPEGWLRVTSLRNWDYQRHHAKSELAKYRHFSFHGMIGVAFMMVFILRAWTSMATESVFRAS